MKHLNVLINKVKAQKCRSSFYWRLKMRRSQCLQHKLNKFHSFHISIIAKINYSRKETENFKVLKVDKFYNKTSLYHNLVWNNFLNKMTMKGKF